MVESPEVEPQMVELARYRLHRRRRCVLLSVKSASIEFGSQGVTARPALGALPNSVNDVLERELVYFPQHGIPTLAWKVIVKTSNPLGEWKFYLDAETGAILDKISLLRTVNGLGRIFDPILIFVVPGSENDSYTFSF